MKKLYIILSLFIVLPTYGDLITTNVSGGCAYDTLGFDYVVSVDAEFEPLNITCSAGQYLPMNSVSCAICPNSAVCNGGTFQFNETKSQGIVFNNDFVQTQSKACDSNLLGIEDTITVTALYEPNTTNINWYSVGDTVYETNTCTYGQPITLPATNPTRPGYIFSGWRLRTQND